MDLTKITWSRGFLGCVGQLGNVDRVSENSQRKASSTPYGYDCFYRSADRYPDSSQLPQTAASEPCDRELPILVHHENPFRELPQWESTGRHLIEVSPPVESDLGRLDNNSGVVPAEANDSPSNLK